MVTDNHTKIRKSSDINNLYIHTHSKKKYMYKYINI